MEHPEAEVEVKVSLGEVMSMWQQRETNDFGPIQAPYVPQEVGRVTIRLLPWVVVN